jgi:hypothetical protein
MFLCPSLQLADADQDTPPATDHAKVRPNVTLEVIETDAQRFGCLRLRKRDALNHGHAAAPYSPRTRGWQ